MPRSQKMSPNVQTAKSQSSSTPCALSAVSTKVAHLSQKTRNSLPLIGIDLLGGDCRSHSYLLTTLRALLEGISSPCHFCFFIFPEDRPHFEAFARTHKDLFKHHALCCLDADEVIEMDDDPLLAVRRKKSASISIGMKKLKAGELNALISTGNTGALIASAALYLPLLPGIKRAALIALLPTKRHPVAVIDVGANIHCSADHLVQFAQLGVAYQQNRGIHHPAIGLLNIGAEEKKGRAELREAYRKLQELYPPSDPCAPIFTGNIEGEEIFSGAIDVLVTDGFTGNVFLKTAEGISSFILETLNHHRHAFAVAKPLLKKLESELLTAESHGAILCGIDGIVIKCHGNAKPAALLAGVQSALDALENQFLARFKCSLTTH